MFTLHWDCLLKTATLSSGREGEGADAGERPGWASLTAWARLGAAGRGRGEVALPGAPKNISGLEAGSSATALSDQPETPRAAHSPVWTPGIYPCPPPRVAWPPRGGTKHTPPGTQSQAAFLWAPPPSESDLSVVNHRFNYFFPGVLHI